MIRNLRKRQGFSLIDACDDLPVAAEIDEKSERRHRDRSIVHRVPKLSVIIPTYRRADILRRCLEHLEKQTAASDLEVIVVSDGKDRSTAALFELSSWRIPVKFFEIEKSQQGSARNEGLRHAEGMYVLFIGDDIFLEPDACEKHLKTHESCELSAVSYEKQAPLKAQSSKLKAVLGFTTWDPAVGITPVMKWLEKSGWQFGYQALDKMRRIDCDSFIPRNFQHRYTYTSHISLPLSIAKKKLFRTDIHLYGWEDIEWGMRLRDSGVRLLYAPDAKALHHHRMTLEESLRRMETLGHSAVEIQKKVPEFDRVPKGWKLFTYRLLALLPTLAGKHRKAFLSGLSEKR